MRRFMIWIILLLFGFPWPAFAQNIDGQAGGASLTVKENDSSPTVSNVQSISFSNGTVTDDGGGNVSVAISGTGAPTDATYLTQTPNGTLTNEQPLSALSTGCMGSTTTTGVVATRTITGTANQISVANGDCGGNPTLSIPTNPTLPGTTTGTCSGNLPGAVTGNASTATALAADPADCAANNFATSINASGTLGCGQPSISAGVSGLGTGVATFLGTPSSANLAAALTDETGTGANVFGTAPTISSAVLTTKVNLPRVTALPGTPATGDTVIVTDDSAVGACDSAAGSATTLCQYNGSAWVPIGDGNVGSAAPSNATYIVQTANGTLTNEQALGALATGILKNTTTTGVLSIAAAGTDYVAGTPGTTANAVPRASGTAGTTVKASGVTISDTDVLTAPGGLIAGTSGTGKLTMLEGTATGAGTNAGEHNVYFDSTSHYLSSHVNGGSAVSYFSTLAGQVNALTSKATPTTSDLLMIEDAAATNAKKKATVDGVLAANDARTKTFTNTTMDVEGTGNVLTMPRRIYFPAAGCNNATAGSVWDLPTSNPAVATCKTGTNTQMATLDFADSSNLSAQLSYMLPTTWTGAVDARIKWFTSATSGNIVWQFSTICVADAETDDPAFNTASTVTDAAKGTTLQTNDATISGVTMTGCAAGELLHIKIQRDAGHASDTLAATARLIGVELVIREAL